LQNILRTLVRSGTESNTALNVLIDDYTKYHVVLVVVGGLFLLGLVLLSVFFWRRFRKAPRTDSRRWTFEKKTYFAFGALTVVVGLFMALIVAANLSNVLNPTQGFSGAIGLLGSPRAGTQADELHQAVDAWLQSGSSDVPALVQGRIDDRLSWQRPKAVICSVLLIVFVLLSAGIWRALIRNSRVREGRWKFKEAALLLLGVLAVMGCLLLMLMVMGNTQGSIAPISLTLFYG
jgi:cytochrome bd-type quinol oxidase subunit 2